MHALFAVVAPFVSQAIIKPQYVDHIGQAVKGKVLDILNDKNERNNVEKLLDEMDLRHVLVSQTVWND